MNDGVRGRRPADYFAEELSRKGIMAGDVIADEWGCSLPVENVGFPLAFCCGHLDRDDDESVCFTEPGKPIIKQPVKTIDTTEQITRPTRAMDEILSTDPGIRDFARSEVWSAPGTGTMPN